MERTARTTKNIQGQEAPTVIYSMTTSTREDPPRCMGFPLFLESIERRDVTREGIEHPSLLS